MARTPSNMLALGTAAPAFDLPDPRTGSRVASRNFAGKPMLVAFICNHCPYVIHIQTEFTGLANGLIDRGIGVVAISANDVEGYPEDGPDKMAALAEQHGYKFPYLYDERQEVARAYEAACTPDFYLFDANHTLVYRGQFDSSRPGNGEPVTGSDLRAATEAVLNGSLPSAEQMPSMGCNIKWKPGNEPV